MKTRTALAPLALALALLVGATPSFSKETRCGWMHNPTPGNLWLDDSQGTWILMSQGMTEEALGMENIPDFSEHDFVRTNGYYGYGCACMDVESESEGGIDRIVAVYSFRQLPLAKCQNDKALPSPQ